MGFEPTASSMPSRRAPSCATAPPCRNYELFEILLYSNEKGQLHRPRACLLLIFALRVRFLVRLGWVNHSSLLE
jgi:hypothetical protein